MNTMLPYTQATSGMQYFPPLTEVTIDRSRKENHHGDILHHGINNTAKNLAKLEHLQCWELGISKKQVDFGVESRWEPQRPCIQRSATALRKGVLTAQELTMSREAASSECSCGSSNLLLIWSYASYRYKSYNCMIIDHVTSNRIILLT